MREGPDISQIGALIGDPARANILVALMDGRALTATELAEIAGVTAQTASTHLSKLEAGGLIRPQKQGRHKYFSLAGPKVGQLIEQLSIFAADRGHLRHRPGPKDAAMRKARVCYDHLAGDLGVRMFDSLVARGNLAFDAGAIGLAASGEAFVADRNFASRAGRSAAAASTGASGAITLRVLSAPPSSIRCCPRAGPAGMPAAVSCISHRRGRRRFESSFRSRNIRIADV
jgi:DNA-binding transcriptional ArsR family regulator